MSYRQSTYDGGQRYPPTRQYQDSTQEIDSYGTAQPYGTYEQGGYSYYNTEGNQGAYRDDPVAPTKETDRDAYQSDEAIPVAPQGPKTAQNMRQWRYDHQGNLWTRGSRGRCIGRFCCCTLMIFLFLLIGILLSLALWIKPPNVMIGEPRLMQSESALQINSSGLTVQLGINVSVENPNYFSVDLSKISVDLIYPTNNTNIGGGTLNNLDFKSDQQTNVTFPVDLQYNPANDPNHYVLASLAEKCGILSGSSSDITIDYKLTLDIKVLFIPIKPVINSSFSFACPFSGSEITSYLSKIGLSISDLTSILQSLGSSL